MFRRKRSRRTPWLALLGLAAADQLYRRRSRSRFVPYNRYSRARYRRQSGLRGIIQTMLLGRVGYYSPWLVALRMAANSFRRRGGGATV